MLIKSDFRDFYDGAQASDTDRETVYVRKSAKPVRLDNEEIFGSMAKEAVECFGDWYRPFSWPDTSTFRVGIIAFCGRLYPFWRQEWFLPERVVFTFDQHKMAEDRDTKHRRWPVRMRRTVGELFNGVTLHPDVIERFGAQFVIHNGIEALNGGKDYDQLPRRYDGGGSLWVSENVRLQSLGFHKVMSIPEAYNELTKFVYNMARPARPIPEMSNDVKIEQAGFNLKTSFRRAKAV